MKIEIIMDTIAANRVVKPGDILDLNYKDAMILVGLGKGVEIAEDTPLDDEVVTEEIISDQVRVRRRARKP